MSGTEQSAIEVLEADVVRREAEVESLRGRVENQRRTIERQQEMIDHLSELVRAMPKDITESMADMNARLIAAENAGLRQALADAEEAVNELRMMNERARGAA